jgi:hypothetical protein
MGGWPGMMNWKECERKKSCPISKYYRIVHLEELRKIMETSVTRIEPGTS